MSLSISGTSAYTPVDTEATTAQKAPATKLTEHEQMRQMRSAGESVAQIAAQTGMSTKLVDSTLGIQAASTSSALAGPTASETSSAMKLSVHA